MRGNRLDIKGEPCHGRGTPLRPRAYPRRDRWPDPTPDAPGVTVSGENVQGG